MTQVKDYFLIMLADERLGDKFVCLQDEESFRMKKLPPYHYFLARRGIEIDGKIFLIDQKYDQGLEINNKFK